MNEAHWAEHDKAHATNTAARALGVLTLDGMTQMRWNLLHEDERFLLTDLSGLTPQLMPYKGCRVEVVDKHTGGKRRFWVGMSSGWRPCHTEMKLVTSKWGMAADKEYRSVTLIRSS